MEQPTRSTKHASLLFDFLNQSLLRIMKDLNVRVYQTHLLQALRGGDYAQRVTFCEWYLIIDFAESIMWSDEAIFKS